MAELMRLWHYKLIPYLPRQQLLGQHRECCALRGKGWGKGHSTVDYVFDYPPSKLFAYHRRILWEMCHRRYEVEDSWWARFYRGKNCSSWSLIQIGLDLDPYPEHNEGYLYECLENLEMKGFLQRAGGRFRIRTGKAFRIEDLLNEL